MPINCPRGFSAYNDCLTCYSRRKNQCFSSLLYPRDLSDLLTTNERISMLEDREALRPEEPKWTASQWDYVQQLKGQMLHLEKKVDSLYEKKTKRRDRI